MKYNFTVLSFDSLPSSNVYAKDNYRSLKHKSVVWCDKQTAGVGRFARKWISFDDLTFSIVYKKEIIPFMIPIAIMHALASFQVNAMIKWPNDIMVDSKKVGGILTEVLYENECRNAIIVGIGINLSKIDPSLTKSAASLQLDKKALLSAILEYLNVCEDMNCEVLLEQYLKYHLLFGKKIKLEQSIFTIDTISKEGYLKVFKDLDIRYLKSEEITLANLVVEDK